MIYTVTLNPAVDKTLVLDGLVLGKVNRVAKVFEDAGGKGINVSKMVRNLGGESLAMGITAGTAGLFIRNQLKSLEIENDFVETEGNTRTNIKMVDTVNGIYTDINEPGLEVPTEVLEQLENRLFACLEAGDVLVLSGSVPGNVPKDIYAKWIQRAKALDVICILDAEGELLGRGVEAAPDVVKPNIHELEGLLGSTLATVEDIVNGAGKLLGYGIKQVVVSRGEEGSLFISPNGVWIAKAEQVEVKSTVGAGDAMVGALAYAMDMGLHLFDAARLSVAAATASVSNEGTRMGTKLQTELWKSRIQLNEYIR